MFFIVQEIPIPRFNRRMEQRCKYNHLHTIICNKQVLFLLNQCNIYKSLFSGIDLLFSPVPNASVALYNLPHPLSDFVNASPIKWRNSQIFSTHRV